MFTFPQKTSATFSIRDRSAYVKLVFSFPLGFVPPLLDTSRRYATKPTSFPARIHRLNLRPIGRNPTWPGRIHPTRRGNAGARRRQEIGAPNYAEARALGRAGIATIGRGP